MTKSEMDNKKISILNIYLSYINVKIPNTSTGNQIHHFKDI